MISKVVPEFLFSKMRSTSLGIKGIEQVIKFVVNEFIWLGLHGMGGTF